MNEAINMRKLFTLITGLLLSTALLAQDKGQLYNEGTLYVGPGTLMTAESDFINDTTGQYNNDGEVLLKGGFLNKGFAGFTLPGGLTRFEGYQIQQIAGNKAASYYNVLFRNAHAQFAFLLSDTMNIFGKADFIQGIVDNKNYDGLVIFEDTASHIHVGDQSYVEGKVVKTGQQDFVYPVGKKGYFRPAAVLPGGGQKMRLAGEYFWENSDSLYSHQLKDSTISFIDDHEYWEIAKDKTPADSSRIQLSWRDLTTSQQILDVAEKDSMGYQVVVVHWNVAKGKWENVGGTKDPANRTVTSDKVGQYGIFALGLLKEKSACRKIINITILAGSDGRSNRMQVRFDGNCPDTYNAVLHGDWGVQITNEDGYQPDGIPGTADLEVAQGHTGKDTDGDGDVDEVTLPGSGIWKADDRGVVTFTSNINQPDGPYSIAYSIKDATGSIRDSVFIHIAYVYDVPVANDDHSTRNLPDQTVTVPVLDNDLPGAGGTLDLTTISLYGPAGSICRSRDAESRCRVLEMPGEGTWKADGNGRVSFTPDPGFHTNPASIQYTVENKDGLTSNRAGITIEVIKGHDYFIPNAFTPNGNGSSDVWKIYGSTIKQVYVMVYNQYGQKLFETHKVNEGWDGRYKGNRQPSGVYVYYAKITFYDGTQVTKKGSITLIR